MDHDLDEACPLTAHATIESWDAIVIGAGPAGALAAYLLARGGARVLLIDRKGFPRHKVCGGCLNAHAVLSLERTGLLGRVRHLGAGPVTAIALHCVGRTATLDLPQGLAISRWALDAELVAAAIEAGCEFRPDTGARVVPDDEETKQESWRRVRLARANRAASVARARVVLAADGLAHNSLADLPGLQSVPAPTSHVGVGALVDAHAVVSRAGVITMAVGRRGYVGAVPVEDGRVNVAAAISPRFLKQHGRTGAAVEALLAEAGIPAREPLDAVDWMGTIPLTRRMPYPAARRLFVLGDAVGYVEPFTGEGMAWAFAGAELVRPVALQAIDGWTEDLAHQWVRAHARCIGRSQRWCRLLARGLRVPLLPSLSLSALSHYPGLAAPLLAHLTPPSAANPLT